MYRFPQGFALIPFQDGLIIEGGRRRKYLRGRSALTLLPRLLSGLESARSTDQLENEIKASGANVIAGIQVLQRAGLVETVVGDDAQPLDLGEPRIQFLARLCAGGDSVRSAEHAVGRLESLRVSVSGNRRLSQTLVSALKATGFRDVREFEGHFGRVEGCARTRDLFIMQVDDPDEPLMLAGGGWIDEIGAPVLPVALDQACLTVGPLLGRGHNCIRCYLATVGATDQGEGARKWQSREAAEYEHAQFGRGDDNRTISLEDLASEIVAWHLFLLATGVVGPSAGGQVMTFDTWAMSCEVAPYVSPTLCRECNPLMLEDDARIVLQYERLMEPPNELAAWSDLKDSDPSVSVQADYHHLKEHRREYFAAPRISLTASADANCATNVAGTHDEIQGLTPAVLEQLLARCTGFRTFKRNEAWERWCPSGGNLGSIESFFFSFGIAELPSGVPMFFEPATHEALVLDREVAVPEAVLGLSPRRSGSALIVLVGALSRIYEKYGHFSVRLAHLDAGFALAQLMMVAESLQLRICERMDWTPAYVRDLLHLGDGDLPLVVVEVTANEQIAPLTPVGWLSEVERRSAEDIAKGLTGGLEHSRPIGSQCALTPSTKWSRRGANLVDLDDLLLARRSTREFDPLAPPSEAIYDAVQVAYEADVAILSNQRSPIQPLSFLVLTERVAGLARGMYQWDRKGWMQCHTPGIRNTLAEDLRLTKQVRGAAGYLLVCCSLGRSMEAMRDGAMSAYRSELIRAGIAGYNCWLSLVDVGVGACPLGASVASDLAPYVGRSLADLHHIFTLRFGYPVKAAIDRSANDSSPKDVGDR